MCCWKLLPCRIGCRWRRPPGLRPLRGCRTGCYYKCSPFRSEGVHGGVVGECAVGNCYRAGLVVDGAARRVCARCEVVGQDAIINAHRSDRRVSTAELLVNVLLEIVTVPDWL